MSSHGISHCRSGQLPYHETATYRAVRLAYKGRRIAMEVILPKKRGTIAAVEKKLATMGFTSHNPIVADRPVA